MTVSSFGERVLESLVERPLASSISSKKVYSLFVSTHYPSSVEAHDGGPVYYQQQVLGTVRRSDLGIG